MDVFVLCLPFLIAVHAAPQLAIEDRVESILSKMTREEKLEMLGGIDDFYTRPIARLGIPRIKMSDGPMGPRNDGPATAFPAGVGLAATWDRKMARRIGEAFGLEARARGVHILLAPGVNIARVPQNGRNFEYLGEDPYLASQMVVPYIEGVQTEGVVATVKHFAMNNQETERNTISSEVDERTMHEIYLPAFKAAVQEGHAWSVMASYNRINGSYAAENKILLNDILKDRWGFKGFVMSDWGATHNGLKSALNGLDLEMPGPEFMTPAILTPLIDSGAVPMSVVDDKVRRMLRVFVSMGFLDREQKLPEVAREPAEARIAARRGAEEGIVLLTNRSNALPLDRSRVRRVAIFGPNADPAVTGGGGSSTVQPIAPVSALAGIRSVGKVASAFVPFTANDRSDAYKRSKFVGLDGTSPGLDGEYFNNPDLKGTAIFTRRDEHLYFNWSGKAPFDGGKQTDFSVRWRGFMVAESTAPVEFSAFSDDGSRVYIDDKLVIDQWHPQGGTEAHATVNLVKGHRYKVRVEYFQLAGDALMCFGYTAHAKRSFDKEIAAAKNADAAIVCVGFGPNTESEGFDRTFGLPEGQDELIEAVAKANPRTIVVINSGGAVDMSRWANLPAAIVQAWYPGSEGGTALAEILFGDVNPSGKLPASFERRVEDNAAYGNFPGSNGKVEYKEGVFVGYRHFDHAGIKPQFAFGHGLSYTSFALRNLTVEAPSADGKVKVWFKVKNTGNREGAEVAQIYVGEANPTVPRPVKELKLFTRVNLKPGEEQNVVLVLDRSAFAFYDANSHDWKVNGGAYNLYLGAASDDIRAKATVAVPGG